MEGIIGEILSFVQSGDIIRLFLMMFCYYSTLLLVPAYMFREYLHGRDWCYKFLFCILVGNFYIINIVLYLALFHMLSSFTTILFVFGGAVGYRIVYNRKRVFPFFRRIKRDSLYFMNGTIGFKSLVGKVIRLLKRKFKKYGGSMGTHFARHIPEFILVCAFMVITLAYFGYGSMRYYCFGFGDVYVHTYWIEAMAEGKMFVQGIYPFGMHAMVYFINTVFRFDVYYILRFFGLMQTLLMMMTVYCLGRKLCKNRYSPFIGCALITFLNCFNADVLKRLQWSLPQESGMFTIYPCAIFLFMVLDNYKSKPHVKKMWHHQSRAEKRELRQSRTWRYYAHEAHLKWKKYCTPELVLFGISVSLTMIYHFYLTIFAFFLCLAIVIGYFFRVWRMRYLGPVAICCVLSLLMAVGPYVVGFASGIKINYSLRWALGVMSTDGVEGSDTGNIVVNQPTDLNENDESTIQAAEEAEKQTEADEAAEEVPGIKGKLTKLYHIIYNNVASKAVIEPWFTRYLYSIAITTAAGLLLLPFKRMRNRAAARLSFSIYTIFMMLLFVFDDLGLPQLVAPIRVNTFIVLALPIEMSMVLDLPLEILTEFFSWITKGCKAVVAVVKTVCCLVALSATVATTGYFYKFDQTRAKLGQELLQYNAAVTCLEKIIDEYPRYKWTIVSVTDETRLVWDHGYHTEIIDFLAGTDEYYDNQTFTIPSEYVFFYIEKHPMSYAQTISYNLNRIKKGEVSEELAAQALGDVKKDSDYYAGQRPILMSMMYYWAQEFQRLFPGEMETFYEDDDFVVYMVRQNEYRLYNFSIDYGFNRVKMINR